MRSIRRGIFTALVFTALAIVLAAIAPTPGATQTPARPAAFGLEEATIAQLQHRMESGQDTARSLVDKYLARIEAIDRQGPALHSVIEINPEARAIADRLDAERKAKAHAGRCTASPCSSRTTSPPPIA
jgi:hypothetical protein